VEEKTREGGALGVFEGGRGGGELEGSVGPDGGAWRSFSMRATCTHEVSRTVGEGGTDCPSVPDRNISSFSKFQT
jgi:hypothetical protein